MTFRSRYEGEELCSVMNRNLCSVQVWRSSRPWPLLQFRSVRAFNLAVLREKTCAQKSPISVEFIESRVSIQPGRLKGEPAF